MALPGAAQVGGFGGPAVLSRGTRPGGGDGARPLMVTGSVTLSGIYSTGLTSAATDGQGGSVEEDSYGANVAWRLMANRTGRRDAVFVAYGGGYTGYGSAQSFSGLNQSLTLSYTRQLTRRWTAFLGQSGITSNTILNEYAPAGTDLPIAEIPNPRMEILDSRYYLLSSAAGLNYQKSARLNFSMAGGALFSRRHSQSLASSNGFIGGGNMSYMMNRRQQIGVSYSYGTYYLTKSFGESQVMSSSVTFGRALNSRWFFNVGAGIYDVHSTRLRTVAVDPAIVLLTGQSQTLEVADVRRQGLAAEGGISGRLRHTTVNFGYTRGITPGNGLYLTAERETVFANLGYSTQRRFSFSGQVEWNRLKATAQDIGQAKGFGGSIGMSYRLISVLHLTGSVYAYHWEIDQSGFARDRISAIVGISFTPGEYPVRLF
jgi:hypothetical protein